MTDEELKALEQAEQTVEVVQDQPKQAAPEDEVAKQLKAQVKAAQETADAERRAREAAERRAQEQEQEVARYHAAMQSTQATTIDAQIESAMRQRELAQREYQSAMESGDYAKAGEAQGKIAEAAADIAQFKRDKASAEQSRPQQQEVRQQQTLDPVEQFIGTATPATQVWLRQHRDQIVTDRNGSPSLAPKVMAAHYEAVGEGHAPDTADYFAFIEGKLKPQQAEPAAYEQPAQQRRPVAAPVSREPPSSNGQPNRQRIQLTREQVEAAHLFGDPKKTEREREIEYWNHLQTLQSEGKIGARA